MEFIYIYVIVRIKRMWNQSWEGEGEGKGYVSDPLLRNLSREPHIILLRWLKNQT